MPTIVIPATGVWVNGNFTVVADEIYISGEDGGGNFRLEGYDNGTFINYGEIRVGGSIGGNAFQANNAHGTIDNRGKVIVTAESYDAWGLHSGNWSPDVVNSGLWQVTAARYAYGILTWSPYGDFENSGDWIVSGGEMAYGAHFINPTSIVNSGSVIVTSASGTATGFAIANFAGGETFHNSGTITISGAAGSFGLTVSGTATATTTPNIVNEGTITADVAIYGFNDQFSPPPLKVEWVLNTGTLNGNVELGLGDDILENRGVINGDILMGDQDDLVDNSGGGVIDGLVDLGFGLDEFRGSSAVDVVNGGHGDDTLRGGGGNDLLVGSHGDDLIEGGAGNDGLFGDVGRDRLVTEGGDYASGGVSDDRIESLDYTFARVDGGEGFDTWVLPTAGRVIDLASVAASGRVTSVENIEARAGDTVVIHAADIAGVTGGQELYVSGVSGASVYLVGSWAESGSVAFQGQTYVRYVLGETVVYVDGDITRALGTTPPTATGLDAVASGAAAPMAGAIPGTEIAGQIIDIGTVELIAPFVVGVDEIWQSLEGEDVFWSFDYRTALTNYGVIESVLTTPAQFATNVIAVEMHQAAELVNNHGVVTASARGVANAFSFYLLGEIEVRNHTGGVIEAYAEAGDATAVYTASLGIQNVTVDNRGTLLAFSETGFATGIFSAQGPGIVNEGVIEAYGGNGAVGIDLSNVMNGSVSNHGDIVVSAADDSDFYAVGIALSRGVVSNTGFLQADIAILMAGNVDVATSINNYDGIIVGDIVQAFSYPPAAFEGGIRLTNTGEIYGAIVAGEARGVSEITNLGFIAGDITLGSGNDRYDASGGVTNGFVFLGGGDDRGTGGAGFDFLIGEAGNDVLSGAGGDDVLVGGSGDDSLDGGDGFDVAAYFDAASGVTVSLAITTAQATGGAGTDTLSGIEDLVGSDFADHLTGNGSDNYLTGGLGNDVLDGGNGVDTATFGFARSDAAIVRWGGTLAVGGAGGEGLDRLTSIEQLQFIDQTVAASDVPSFEALNYVAGYNDLIGAYGVGNLDGAVEHFIRFGFAEGRDTVHFDGWQYLAGYNDLLVNIGADPEAAARHFIQFGVSGGRVRDNFDGAEYIASHNDLITVFGLDEDRAARHFVQFGHAAGRERDTFDGWQYIAGYDDLISVIGADEGAAARHFVRHGYNEGRSRDVYDWLEYIAGYDDLIEAYGANETAGARHFVESGFTDGRERDAFDGLQYIASHGDLIQAFGEDEGRGASHFIQFGYAEGRARDSFDAAQYIANYADLQAAYGDDLYNATRHYILYGYAQGRTDEDLTPSGGEDALAFGVDKGETFQVLPVEFDKAGDPPPEVLPGDLDFGALRLAVDDGFLMQGFGETPADLRAKGIVMPPEWAVLWA